MKYINVVIDNKSDSTDSFFTYSAPDNVEVGARLKVPFAQRRKPLDAYCVESDVVPLFDVNKIKEISEYDEERSLNQEMINIALWMKQRYGVKYIDAIKMFTVAGKRESERKTELSDEVHLPDYELSEEQNAAVAEITDSIDRNSFETYLIKGVTNSGKTEVYIKAVEKALEMGKTAIVLLPEIALSEQVMKRFTYRFGEKKVASLHSKLSTSRRLEEWLRIKRGEASIVIGARTSIFAPLENIGVIVIDEEHEATYKSDRSPKYETVDIAYQRAKYNKSVLILGSATPSVVSYHRAEEGIYKLIRMNSRIANSVMPQVRIVDMRKEAKAGNSTVISRDLVQSVSRTLDNKEQVILFLNRRGYSTQILCPECGSKMVCPDCGVSLTYHKSSNAAVCHYCGRGYRLPESCPECGSRYIKYVGAGTEKVEETVRELWPSATVNRFDLDTAGTKDNINRVISDFQKGKTDILVGTQILAKGLDFRNVGLVGIINADVSLNIPDYRSSERTYQLITQVSGRAGRTGGNSEVIVQTYEPESDVINYAANNNYEEFYTSELLHRNIMNYPPFTDIIQMSVLSDNAELAEKYAKHFRDILSRLPNKPKGSVILNTRVDERKSDGKTRVSFIIKSPQGSRGGYVKLYREFKDKLIANKIDCYIEIDINPYGIS